MGPTHCTLANVFGRGFWHGTSATDTNNMFKGLYWSTFREIYKSWQCFSKIFDLL